MEPNNKTPIYYETAAYARENGELELFRFSHRTNIACKNDIQDAISRHFDGMHLDKETAKEVLDQYGAERVSIVLAATVQYKSWDGRFSSSNKDWAFSCICRKDSRQAAWIAEATTSLTLILPCWMASSGRLAEKSGNVRILL